MKIAVLGTSMAGYVAAHAAFDYFDEDCFVTMYGPNCKPIKAGARFYEREIPGVDVAARMCDTESAGGADGYIDKLGGPISKYYKARPRFLAFDYHAAFETLYSRYNSNVIAMEPDHQMITDSNWDDFDFVFNAGPRPNFYPREDHHMFAATRHWRIDEGDTDEDGAKNPYLLPGSNHDKQLMIFDGTDQSSYFRITQLFGLMTVEWGFHKKPPIAGTYLEVLPLSTPPEMGLNDRIDAWRGTTALAHVGALARWEPSTDVGEVFFQVQSVLSDYENGGPNDSDSRGRD